MANENNENLSIVERFGEADNPNINFKADVPKLRAARKYKVVTEKLLGKYDETGKYVIEPHILAELLVMPKLLDKEEKTGKLLLTAEYKDGTLFKFTATEPRRKKDQTDKSVFSVLELSEEIKFAGGYETETLDTVVGTFKTSDLLNFDKNRRSAFHIFNRDDPDAKKRTPTDNIDARRTFLSLVEESEAKNFAKTEKKFYKQTLKALKKIPGGKKLLAQFKNKQDIIDNFFDKKDKSKYRAYNDMLSLVVNDPENKKIVESVEYQKELGKINKEYLEDMRKIDHDVQSNKHLQDIKKAGDLVAAVPLEEYYQSLTETAESTFGFNAENVRNQNQGFEEFKEDLAMADEKPKKGKNKNDVKIGGKKEKDTETQIADLEKEVHNLKEEAKEKAERDAYNYERNKQEAKEREQQQEWKEKLRQQEQKLKDKEHDAKIKKVAAIDKASGKENDGRDAEATQVEGEYYNEVSGLGRVDEYEINKENNYTDYVDELIQNDNSGEPTANAGASAKKEKGRQVGCNPSKPQKDPSEMKETPIKQQGQDKEKVL